MMFFLSHGYVSSRMTVVAMVGGGAPPTLYSGNHPDWTQPGAAVNLREELGAVPRAGVRPGGAKPIAPGIIDKRKPFLRVWPIGIGTIGRRIATVGRIGTIGVATIGIATIGIAAAEEIRAPCSPSRHACKAHWR